MKKHIFWHNFYHFFSNVAEKAVIFSDGEYRYKLWNSLSKDKDGYEKNEIFMKNYYRNLDRMVNNSYANYVI